MFQLSLFPSPSPSHSKLSIQNLKIIVKKLASQLLEGLEWGWNTSEVPLSENYNYLTCSSN